MVEIVMVKRFVYTVTHQNTIFENRNERKAVDRNSMVENYALY